MHNDSITRKTHSQTASVSFSPPDPRHPSVELNSHLYLIHRLIYSHSNSLRTEHIIWALITMQK